MFKLTKDQECFGDAVPPLVSFRIGLQIYEKQTAGLAGGGESIVPTAAPSVYNVVASSPNQGKTMLELLYRFNSSKRAQVGHPAIATFLEPFEVYLRDVKGLKSAKQMADSLRTIVLAHPLFSSEGVHLFEQAERRRRRKRKRTKPGGSVASSAINKVADFLRQQTPLPPKRVFFDNDDTPSTPAGQESLRVYTKGCEALGFTEYMTPDEAKQHYRNQARKMHPDKGGKIEEFQRLKECYENKK